MKKHYTPYIFIAACILVMHSCVLENAESKMQKLADSYKNKKISNSQMLFGMGKIFREHPDNYTIRTEYFQKMIISGYTSHIIHFYLNRPDHPLNEKDMEILLLALHKGNHYNLAEKLYERFSGKYLGQLRALAGVYDSLMHYNTIVKNNPDADAYVKRGRFFTRLDAVELANADMEKSIELNPCNPDAVFEKLLVLINAEKTKEAAELLDRCNQNFVTAQPQWFTVFYTLATEMEKLKRSHLSTKESLFNQANLYINAGFPEIALRKSKELLQADGNSNPDYLALQGFIYYKMNNKEMAKQYVSEAERISGKKSKLSTMIAKME